jgi:O-methyltransferase
MSSLKSILTRLVCRAGYTLTRTSALADQSRLQQNFVNLVEAYIHHLDAQSPPTARLGTNSLRCTILGRLIGTPPSEAFYLLQGLAATRSVEGDVCEFGVAQGETSALIANELAAGDKTLHLFDSFSGLPKPTDKDQLKDDIFNLGSMAAYEGKMACAEDLVKARLRAIGFPETRTIIHKGYLDQVLHADRSLPARVSFAYLDFDFYEPIKQALEFLHPRMPVGGVLVVDDYDYFSTGVKVAVDEFVASHDADTPRYRVTIPDKALGCFAVLDRVTL